VCRDSRLITRMMQHHPLAVSGCPTGIKNIGKIKKFTLLPQPFSMERGELTNTLKIKRSVLNKNYAVEIEKMYEE
jgi:long-subunit acyl-CoA synthetase (AMP-forming)